MSLNRIYRESKDTTIWGDSQQLFSLIGHQAKILSARKDSEDALQKEKKPLLSGSDIDDPGGGGRWEVSKFSFPVRKESYKLGITVCCTPLPKYLLTCEVA